MKLVSILVPAYNAEKWLASTLASALAQTWRNTEIIVVDDGSRDETLRIARRFESGTVKVVTQDNRGACVARNRALALAQGDYIQWLDADDLLHPAKIATQLNDGGEGEPIVMTSAWGRFYVRADRARFCPDSLWSDHSPVEWLITKLRDSVWMNPTAWLVSRQVTERAGQWDSRLSLSAQTFGHTDDDGEYLCRLVANCSEVKFSRNALCYYRVGNFGSLSSRSSAESLDLFFLATYCSVEHLLRLEDSERTRRACISFVQRRLSYFERERPDLAMKTRALAERLGGSLKSELGNWRYRVASALAGQRRAQLMKDALWTARIKLERKREQFLW